MTDDKQLSKKLEWSSEGVTPEEYIKYLDSHGRGESDLAKFLKENFT